MATATQGRDVPKTERSPAASAPAAPRGFRPARRVHRSLLAESEKRLLVWLARRTPPSIGPDHLTLLGLVSLLGAGLAYALTPRLPAAGPVAATVFLALNWLGDSLDGTLARVRDRQRPRYGFYVDHVVDTFGATFLLGGLALSGLMTPSVAVAVLVAFLMLANETYLAAHVLHEFRLSHGVFGPTEGRILLGLGNLVALAKPAIDLFGRSVPLFDLGGVIAAGALATMLVVSSVRRTVRLYREETPA